MCQTDLYLLSDLNELPMRKIIIPFVFLTLSTLYVQAQEMHITGTITRASQGDPLPGVTVVVQGTSKGVISDFEGRYSISAPAGSVLKFSSVGMVPFEVTLEQETMVNVQLKDDITGLDEVIVVGYGTSSKASFVGSASVVNTPDMKARPVSSVEKSLQGMIPGLLTSTQSGTPGSGTDVILRGVGSINASTDPLYIVDGVPIATGDVYAYRFYTTNPLASLEPSDIESVTVLKDASATSIYGARASNGVIVITTRQGSAGKTHFNFSTQLGRSRRVTDNFDVLNTPEYKELVYEQLVNAGVPNYEAYARILEMGNENTDWMDEVFRTGTDQRYNLQASGGNNQMNFFVSGNYRNQQGVVIGSDMERYSARANMRYTANPWLRLGVNSTLSYVDVNGSSGPGFYSDPVTSAYFIPPVYPVRTANGEFNHHIPENLNYNAVSATVLDNVGYDEKRYLGNFTAEATPLDGLAYKFNGGMDYFYMGEYLFWNPKSPSGEGYKGYSEYASIESRHWILTHTLNYKKTFGNHDLDLLLGQEAQKTNEFSTRLANSKFPSDRFVTLVNGADPLTASTLQEGTSLASFFTSLGYTLRNKYIVQLTGRRDGSSRFGANNRWANFGSIGAAWHISNEAFMDPLTFIDDLKLRVSQGTSGNQSILGYDSDGNPYNDYYTAMGLYQFGADYNGEPGSQLYQIENPDLRWEKNATTNLGIDWVSLGGRFNGTVELYQKNTKDLLLLVPISVTTGLDVVMKNVGAMENKGIELELEAVLVDRSFQWTMGYNFTANKNKVTALDNNEPIYDASTRQQATVGKPYRTFYLPRWGGVNPADGSALWLDADGRPVMDYNQAEAVLLSYKADPDFYGSVVQTFRYKGITLSVQWYGLYGNSIYNNSDRYLSSDGQGTANVDRRQLERWMHEGDITSVPIRVDGSTSGNKESTRYLEDGSYLKLKNITLSYDLPTKVITKLHCEGLQVYFLAENAYTWTHFTGLDPEGSLKGLSWFKYPNAKTFALGMNLNF